MAAPKAWRAGGFALTDDPSAVFDLYVVPQLNGSMADAVGKPVHIDISSRISKDPCDYPPC